MKSYFGSTIIRKVGFGVKKKWPHVPVKDQGPAATGQQRYSFLSPIGIRVEE